MGRIQEIQSVIQEADSRVTGKLGAGFIDLNTRESCYLRGEELFPTASVFKVFVLAELFRKVHSGEISLEDRYPLTEEIKSPGSGVLFQLRSGTPYTIYDYAMLMMIISDNTCADFLYHLVGAENIRRNVLEPLGLSHTRVDLSCAELFTTFGGSTPDMSIAEQYYRYNTGDFRNSVWYRCEVEKSDMTTMQDLAKFLETVYQGEWYGRETCDKMLDIMKKCQTNSRIPKYLPKGTVVAHKTGTFDRLSNDSGIVYTPKGDYILTMSYNGNLASEEEYYGVNDHGFYGDEIMAHLSRSIYDIFVR